ncbi:uncharacterized protein LOC134812887 [Bolinopsis microptera]|uniref:uncharacterized protein LOC134812887 n=1 Tax=Bolinopsis microptera TaxID=2820187 RepID=UPI003079C67B
MVKFDVRQLRYLSREEFRCLTSLEMGMKNHEIVPSELIASIANLRHGGCYKILRDLVQYKLIRYDHRNGIRGYHLTYAGYDYLALRSFSNQNVVHSIGNKIGVGKESDIYIAASEDWTQYVLKLHRLGRICFRKVKEKRDYLKRRKNASWLYLSRLAAEREYSFLKALFERGYPVPEPLSWNRHAIVMKLVPGYPLSQVNKIANPAKVYTKLMQLIVRLAQMGLIHGDFNEFNIMINDKEKITVIDLPQMISTSHENAEYYFDRDVECVRTWFKKRYNFDSDDRPYLSDMMCETPVDVEMKASGYTRDIKDDFEKLTLNKPEDDLWDVDDLSEDDEEESSEEESGGEGSGELGEEEEEEDESNISETEEGDVKEKCVSEESSDEEEKDEDDESDDEINNKSYLPYRDKEEIKEEKEGQKKSAHQFTVYQKTNLSKDDVKKKVRANETKKRLKQNRIKKGEKYYINREKRAVTNEIKGADSWF